MLKQIIKSEISQVIPVVAVLFYQVFSHGVDSFFFGGCYAFISILILRILFLSMQKKDKLDTFFSYIVNPFLMITILLAIVAMDELVPLALGFLIMAFGYSVLITLVPPVPYSLYSIIRARLKK
jgi:hypothetical protein